MSMCSSIFPYNPPRVHVHVSAYPSGLFSPPFSVVGIGTGTARGYVCPRPGGGKKKTRPLDSLLRTALRTAACAKMCQSYYTPNDWPPRWVVDYMSGSESSNSVWKFFVVVRDFHSVLLYLLVYCKVESRNSAHSPVG